MSYLHMISLGEFYLFFFTILVLHTERKGYIIRVMTDSCSLQVI